jgi:hypothetical protein
MSGENTLECLKKKWVMGDKEKYEEYLKGFRSFGFCIGAKPIRLGEIVKSELSVDDVDIHDCSKELKPIEFAVAEAGMYLRDIIGKSALPINPICSVFIQARPHTKRRVNYQTYEQRWRKATSLRKAKKYAKILGYNKTHNERYKFWPLPYGLYIPRAEIHPSIDMSNHTTTINVKALSNDEKTFTNP